MEKQDVAKEGEIAVDHSEDMGWGHRHIQAMMMFCCLVTAYSLRSCMGVSLEAMSPHHGHDVNNTHLGLNNNMTFEDNSTFINNTSSNISNDSSSFPKFDWSKKMQDMIQTSFFLGYMLMQLPAGALAHRFGAKFLLVTAMMVNSVISIIIPWAAIHGGAWWLVACRTVQGLSQAFVVPSLHTLLGKWAPVQERGRISAFVHGGGALGTVVGLPITGFIAASSQGWPGIFRFYGVLAAVVGGTWAWFGAESPAYHKKISNEERMYIQLGLGVKNGGLQEHIQVPWKSILMSSGMWAIVAAHISNSWGQITLYSQIPSYMSNVMNVNIKQNGMLTALPFLVMWLANFFFSWVTDLIINRKLLSITATRKLANSVGCFPAALGMVALAFVPPHSLALVETILVIICAFKIATHVGFQVNHIDISPNFAGTMISISNFVSNAIASFSPLLTAYILGNDPMDRYKWRYVFLVAGAIYFFSNVVYVCAGTAKQAAWNDPQAPEAQRCELDTEKHESKL